MTSRTLYAAALLLCLAFAAPAPAQSSDVPKNCVQTKDGKIAPAPGYTWVSAAEDDHRVKWNPGARHPSYPSIYASTKENSWTPAAGYKWLNNTNGDLRVVKIEDQQPTGKLTDEQIGRAVLKAVGALALHQAGKPQDDDTLGKAILRGISRAGRDKLIDSTLEDLMPAARQAERDSIRNLAVLALDGELSTDSDAVTRQLRKINSEMADAVEIAEFLIQLAQAAKK